MTIWNTALKKYGKNCKKTPKKQTNKKLRHRRAHLTSEVKKKIAGGY